MPLVAYTSDLHGNIALYEEFLELARQRSAMAAIIGGDLLPHTSSRASAIAQQCSFISEKLRPLLERYHAEGGPPLLVIPGNDDWAASCEALQSLEEAGLLENLHMRSRALENYFIAGYSCVPPTPFSIKDWERPEEQEQDRVYSFDHALQSTGGAITGISEAEFRARSTIAVELEALAALSSPQRTIYVCHSPPYATGLDRTQSGRSVGSRDLRLFIERHQPRLTLHGHIHEAPRTGGSYAARLGACWCVNPGQADELHAVLVDPAELPESLWHTRYGGLEEHAS